MTKKEDKSFLYYLDNMINTNEIEKVVGSDGIDYAVLSKDVCGKTFAASWVNTEILRGRKDAKACSAKK